MPNVLTDIRHGVGVFREIEKLFGIERRRWLSIFCGNY
jgi:hypothetical protein